MIWDVAIGGAFGSAARFLPGAQIRQQRAGLAFPMGILVISYILLSVLVALAGTFFGFVLARELLAVRHG